MIGARDQVGFLLQRRQGIGNRNSEAAGLEQSVVVFGVANADGLGRRDVELA